MALGEKITELRKTAGYSQKELADLIGEKSAKVISNWEINLNKPDIDKISRLCNVFGCPASYFVDDSNQFDMTKDEMAFVYKLRGLDDIGKDVVLSNLDYQLDRCKNLGIEIAKEHTAEQGDLFISKDDADYDEMKEKCKTLTALKKNSYLNDSEIRLLLAYNDGYFGKLSIADLAMLFHGMKVPSAELYNDVYRILERTPKTT